MASPMSANNLHTLSQDLTVHYIRSGMYAYIEVDIIVISDLNFSESGSLNMENRYDVSSNFSKIEHNSSEAEYIVYRIL